eukprot:1172114-Prymnesium_polylepis.2
MRRQPLARARVERDLDRRLELRRLQRRAQRAVLSRERRDRGPHPRHLGRAAALAAVAAAVAALVVVVAVRNRRERDALHRHRVASHLAHLVRHARGPRRRLVRVRQPRRLALDVAALDRVRRLVARGRL